MVDWAEIRILTLRQAFEVFLFFRADLLDLSNDLQRRLQLRDADAFFKGGLQTIEGPHHLHGGFFPGRHEDQLISPSVLRIDLPSEQTLSLERRNTVADITAGR